jgi:type I restriction enzyme S subunit
MAELDTIDVELKDLKIVKSVFARHLPYKQVWAYGSRVKWTAGHTSDLDCVVFDATDSEIADAKEAFDESDIPFEVQLLNWEIIPDDFKENIQEQYFVLQSRWDWKETTLGNLMAQKGYIRGPFGSSLKRQEMKDFGIPVYEQKNAIYDHRDFRFFIDEKKFKELKRFQVKTNDLIISCSGTVGQISIIKENDTKGIISQALLILRPDIQKIDLKFLFYFLTSRIGFELITQASHGSVQVNIAARATVEAIPILTPPLSEQKAIASVLSSLDDKIDLLHRQNKTLESIAETLFRQWFIEEAQDDWEEVKLGDIIDVRDGTHDSPKQKDFGKYLITSKHLKVQSIDYDSAYLIAEEDFNDINRRSKVHKNDILFSMIGTLGVIHYIYYEPDYAIKNIGLFKTSEKLWFSKFLYLLLKSPIGQRFIHENAKGSTQEYITLGSLREFEFNYPGHDKVKEFNEVVELYFDKLFANCKQIKTLESLRDTLLPKLISGNIRVEYEAAA